MKDILARLQERHADTRDDLISAASIEIAALRADKYARGKLLVDVFNDYGVEALNQSLRVSIERVISQRKDEAGYMNLIEHLHRQRAWSLETFGPGYCHSRVIDHLRKEINEVEAAPLDLTEWVDVVLLALDGAWRAGYSPIQIAAAIEAKQARNEMRQWPDWRTADADKAIEHVKA